MNRCTNSCLFTDGHVCVCACVCVVLSSNPDVLSRLEAQLSLLLFLECNSHACYERLRVDNNIGGLRKHRLQAGDGSCW